MTMALPDIPDLEFEPAPAVARRRLYVPDEDEEDEETFESRIAVLPSREQQRQRRVRSQRTQERLAKEAAEEADFTSPLRLAGEAASKALLESPVSKQARGLAEQAAPYLSRLGTPAGTGGYSPLRGMGPSDEQAAEAFGGINEFLAPSGLDVIPLAGKADEIAEGAGAVAKRVSPAARRLLTEQSGSIRLGGKADDVADEAGDLLARVDDAGDVPPLNGRAELGDSGIKSALAAKEETTLEPGRLLGDEGSIQRKVVGALNPSVDIPRPVHVANQARAAVSATLRTDLARTEAPAYRKVAALFAEEAPAYTGPADRPLAGTWVDYLENPRFYSATDELLAAKEELRAAQDAVMGKVRSEYGIDVKPFQGADEGAVYVPHKASRESIEEAAESVQRSLSSRSGVAKERAYDSLSDRVAKDPNFKPELDPRVLADVHSGSLASMAANATFKAGVGGRTKLEVVNELHPGLRDSYDNARRTVDNLKGRIETAGSRERGAGQVAEVTARQQAAIEKKMEPLLARIEGLGEEYGPELSFLSGQLRELRLQAARMATQSGNAGERASAIGEFKRALTSDLDDAQAKLMDLAKRYRTAGTGDYVLNRETFRFFDAKTSDAIHSVGKQSFDNAFIDSALEVGNKTRAAALGPDFSPLTIQGALGAFSHPEVAIQHAGTLARAAFMSPDEFAKILDPDLVRRFEFASNRQVGSLSEEMFGTRGIRLPGQPIKKFNDALQRVVDYGTLMAFKNDADLLVKLGLESKNVADNEAAKSISTFIPRLINTDTARSAQRVKLEGALPTSRSFTASPFILAKDYASAIAKVGTGQELQGREMLALVRGTVMASTMLGTTVSAALLSAEANGKSPAEAVKEVVDPDSPRFMHVNLGDKGSVPLGGPFRSAILGAYRTATEGPSAAGDFAKSKLQPAIGATAELADNRDWRGRPIAEGSVWQQALDLATHYAENANLLVGGALEGAREGGVEGAATEFASGLAGTNYKERSPIEIATQELYPGRQYDELLTSEQDAVKALAAQGGRRSEPSEYAADRDRRIEGRTAAIAEKEEAWKRGELSGKSLPEAITDIKRAYYQSLDDYRNDKDNQAYFKNLPDRKHQETLDGFFAKQEKHSDGEINWEATIAQRDRYIAGLDPKERAWLEDYIGAQESKKSQIEKDLSAYNDKRESLGYFKNDADRKALDKANPDIDVSTWLFYGGQKDKTKNPDPVLNSAAAVKQALEMNVPSRDVKLDGLKRPINESEGTVAAFNEYGERAGRYLTGFYVERDRERIANAKYKKSWDTLSAPEQTWVKNYIQNGILEDAPDLEAYLAWMGQRKTIARTTKGRDTLRYLRSTYGEEPEDKDGPIRYRD